MNDHNTRISSLSDLRKVNSVTGRPYLDGVTINPYTGKQIRLVKAGEGYGPGDLILLPGKTRECNEDGIETGWRDNDVFIILIGDDRVENPPDCIAAGIEHVFGYIKTEIDGYGTNDGIEDIASAWKRATTGVTETTTGGEH